ncbi:MAG: terpene cyclase/mutase family protein [Planctomycetales bacterium]|nr:terpene cyclase/mutase family protein [Planctomycetales bacterium]
MSRRTKAFVVALLVLADRGSFVLGQEVQTGSLVTAETDVAVEKGIEYLSSRQNNDGSFGGAGYSRNVGVVSLAGMAFLVNGSTPGRGLHGTEIDRCVQYVLRQSQPSGFISNAQSSSHGPMYGHGFATLFLAETYGMSQEEGIREKLTKAVQLIINTQNDEGGWRYRPQKQDADISVTICQIMALRAARNAGIYVPNDTVQRCVAYVQKCQNADGGFRYTADAGPSAYHRSAAGVVALFSAGIYEGEHVNNGLRYLATFQAGNPDRNREGHYSYGNYYAAQAMWQAGGEYWQQWYPGIRDELLERQQRDGAWLDSVCPEYGTAMAVIVLQLPNRALPIFQR